MMNVVREEKETHDSDTKTEKKNVINNLFFGFLQFILLKIGIKHQL